MANKFISTSKTGVGTTETAIYSVELQGTQVEKQSVIIGCNLSNTSQTAVMAEVKINRYPAYSIEVPLTMVAVRKRAEAHASTIK